MRFACDGEEETGGNSIVEFIDADERGADAAVIFDSGMIRRGVPAFNIATRGVIYFHLTLRTGERDLHSGLFGGCCAERRARADADAERRRRHRRAARRAAAGGIIPPTEPSSRAGGRAPSGAEELADQGARPMDARAADEFYIRTFAEPALDINGLESGSRTASKTVLPVDAHANVSVRLAPGQDPDTIADGARSPASRRRARGQPS